MRFTLGNQIWPPQRREGSGSWIVIGINFKGWLMGMVVIFKSDLKEGSSGEGLYTTPSHRHQTIR